MHAPVTAACVQVEPVILDRSATLDRLAERTAEAAAQGAQLVVFPETFVPAYPTSAWAKALGRAGRTAAKEAFALLHRESLEVPEPDADRLGSIAREHGVWLVVGVNELDPERPGDALQLTPLPTRRRASSRCTTVSSCRRTTSGSCGGRATDAAYGRSRRRSAGSAG